MALLRVRDKAWLSRVVFVEKGAPLMTLEEYHLNIDKEAEEACVELERLIERHADESCTWAYLPQYRDIPEHYAACRQLEQKLQEEMRKYKVERSMRLVFIRRTTSKPISQFGGLHVDVDIGVKHQRDPAIADNTDILRLILNLGDSPRIVEYAPKTKQELRNLGYKIPDGVYKQLDSELKDTPRKRIEIPARQGSIVYGLKFWASLVPHAGITDERGHFVAAFGKYANIGSVKL